MPPRLQRCWPSRTGTSRQLPPLDVVITHGAGALVVDTAGEEYLDFLAAYSATNFGHRHPVPDRRGT